MTRRRTHKSNIRKAHEALTGKTAERAYRFPNADASPRGRRVFDDHELGAEPVDTGLGLFGALAALNVLQKLRDRRKAAGL